LSAITAGFLGSSSGIPASTFPTKSAPTSAPLVKIPPPNLAKIEIKEAPKPRATRALTIGGACILTSILGTFYVKLGKSKNVMNAVYNGFVFSAVS
jgi:hypothetical protein